MFHVKQKLETDTQKDMIMNEKELSKYIRNIPDFPKKGIQFKDITTLLKEPEALRAVAEILADKYRDKGITKVAGIESRGFIFGAILAEKLNAGFIPIRKPGKLPADVLEESFEKEYGTDKIQIHKGSIDENDVVLLHDDLLATGGTMSAACKLVRKFRPKKIYVNFIIELAEIDGRKALEGEDVDVMMKL